MREDMLKYIHGKKRPDLKSSFQSHLASSKRLSMYGIDDQEQSEWDNMIDYYNTIYGEEDINDNNLYDIKSKRNKCKRTVTRRGSGSTNKRSTHVSSDSGWNSVKRIMNRLSHDEEYEDEEEDSNLEDKIIYYYPDYTNQNDVVEFTNLYEFDEYLSTEGINISISETSLLRYRTVSHCCINPKDKDEHGILNLITDHSYGALYYTCNEYNYV